MKSVEIRPDVAVAGRGPTKATMTFDELMNLLGGTPTPARATEAGGRRCSLPPQPIVRLRLVDGYLGTNRYGSEADFHIRVDDGVAVLCGTIYVEVDDTLSLIDAFALRETSN